MDIHEVLNHARDAMTVKRVFGDPYERRTGRRDSPWPTSWVGRALAAVPVSRTSQRASTRTPVGEGARDASYGLGYGLRVSPAGVYVIKAGEVEWKPALDMNRASLQRAGVAIVALCVLRSIIRTLATR